MAARKRCDVHGVFVAGCLGCRQKDSAYNRNRDRQIAYGTWLPRVPGPKVWAHVEVLIASGMTQVAIAAAAGLHRQTVCNFQNVKWVRGQNAAAVFAVQPRRVPTAAVPAVGTVRRLRAMVALGYAWSDLGEMLDRHPQQVWDWANGEHDEVTVATAQAVAALYDRAGITLAPPSKRATEARRRAERAGWPSPLAWNDGDIDDPSAQPRGLRRRDGDRAEAAA